MSDNVQLAQNLVDARAAVASPEYAERVQRLADIEAEAAQIRGIQAAADARLQRAAIAIAEIGNAEAYEAGFAAALALVASQAAAEAAATVAPVVVEAPVEAPVEVAPVVVAVEAPVEVAAEVVAVEAPVEVAAEVAPEPAQEVLPGLVLTVE
jgi:hypothetical protein